MPRRAGKSRGAASRQSKGPKGPASNSPQPARAPPASGTAPRAPPASGTAPRAPPAYGAVPRAPPAYGAVPRAPPAYGAVPRAPPASGTVPQAPPAYTRNVQRALPASWAGQHATLASWAIPRVPPAYGSVPRAPPAYSSVSRAPPAYGSVSRAPPAYGSVSRAPPAYGSVSRAPPAYGSVSRAPPAYGSVSRAPPAYGSVPRAPPAYGSVPDTSADESSSSSEEPERVVIKRIVIPKGARVPPIERYRPVPLVSTGTQTEPISIKRLHLQKYAQSLDSRHSKHSSHHQQYAGISDDTKALQKAAECCSALNSFHKKLIEFFFRALWPLMNPIEMDEFMENVFKLLTKFSAAYKKCVKFVNSYMGEIIDGMLIKCGSDGRVSTVTLGEFMMRFELQIDDLTNFMKCEYNERQTLSETVHQLTFFAHISMDLLEQCCVTVAPGPSCLNHRFIVQLLRAHIYDYELFLQRVTFILALNDLLFYYERQRLNENLQINKELQESNEITGRQDELVPGISPYITECRRVPRIPQRVPCIRIGNEQEEDAASQHSIDVFSSDSDEDPHDDGWEEGPVGWETVPAGSSQDPTAPQGLLAFSRKPRPSWSSLSCNKGEPPVRPHIIMRKLTKILTFRNSLQSQMVKSIRRVAITEGVLKLHLLGFRIRLHKCLCMLNTLNVKDVVDSLCQCITSMALRREEEIIPSPLTVLDDLKKSLLKLLRSLDEKNFPPPSEDQYRAIVAYCFRKSAEATLEVAYLCDAMVTYAFPECFRLHVEIISSCMFTCFSYVQCLSLFFAVAEFDFITADSKPRLTTCY